MCVCVCECVYMYIYLFADVASATRGGFATTGGSDIIIPFSDDDGDPVPYAAPALLRPR